MNLLKLLFWPGPLGFIGGGDAGDGGAAEARRTEEARQAKITEGTNKVNELFGGPVTRTRQVAAPAPAAPVWESPSWSQGNAEHGIGGPAPAASMAPNSEHATGGSGWVTNAVPKTETYTENAPGQFTDDYFSGIGNAYRNYYLPQVDQQYQEALRAIKVGSPSLQSSAFARKEGRLTQDYERSKGDVADRALSAEGDSRGAVENSRNQILAAVRAGAGAEDAAASATNSLKTLKAPPVYSPIGDLFARYLNTAANATVANNMGYAQTPLSLNTLFNRPGGGSALRTVN